MKKTLKQILSVLLVAVMIIGSAPMSGFAELEFPKWLNFDLFKIKASAEEFDYGDYTYTLDSENNATITGFKKSYSGNLDIPSSIGDANYPVVAIGNSAFKNCENLTSVTIPNSVTSIGNYAFSGCTQLASIALGSVETLGYFLFANCISLKNITIPKTVKKAANDALHYGVFAGSSFETATIEKGITKIPDHLFSYCTTLKTVTIPGKDDTSENYEIGDYAFNGCESLTSVTIPDSVTSVGDNAFSGCVTLTNVSIPDSVTSISNNAFSGCASFTSITIPDSVTSIGSNAFSGCTQLASIDLGSVETLGYFLFKNCISLKNITIPKTVKKAANDASHNGAFAGSYIETATIEKGITKIPDHLFSFCTTLKMVTIPGKDDTSENYEIGDYAFNGCESLTSVTIPDSVTSIGQNAFRYCKKLKDVDLGKVQFLGAGAFLLTAIESIILPSTIQTTESTCEAWFMNAATFGPFAGSSLKTVTFEEGTNSIPDYCLACCTKLTNVQIPSSATNIGEYAFYKCESMTSITIPDNVTSISDYAFSGCTGLTSISIPDSVTSISDCAFSGCTSLTSVSIPDSVTTIGNSSFKNCESLAGVKIPDSVTIIGNSAFENCVKISEIDFTQVETIGKKAFANTGLIEITIPDSVTDIYENAFSNCSINKVVFNSNKCRFEHSWSGERNDYYPAFENCNNLTTIIFGENVTDIPAYICKKVYSLESIVFMGEIKTIGDGAFCDCTSLTKVTIPDSVTTIGNSAFKNCNSLISVTVPNSVTTIGNYSFSGCTQLTSIDLGSVETLGYYMFSGCDSLKNVTIPKTVKKSNRYNNNRYYGPFANSSIETATIEKGIANIPEYLFSNCTTLKTIAIPEKDDASDGYSIGDYAFSDCASLTSVTVPNSVTTIGNYSFSGCTHLTSIDLGGVETLGYYMFSGCDSLKSVTIPKTVKNVKSYSNTKYYGPFANSSIETAKIEKDIASIPAYLFSKCSTLKTVIIPEKDDTSGSYAISDYAFNGCASLTSVSIPDSVTSIGNNTFSGCVSLTSVSIPDSVTTIGNSAFNGCKSLTSVSIPDSVTSISDNEFSGCTSLTSVSIPDSVTTIGNYAFSGCTQLASIDLGNVETLGYYLFVDCISLNSVTVPKTVKKVDNNNSIYGAFTGSSVETATIEKDITNIPAYLFSNCTTLKMVTIPGKDDTSENYSIGDYAFNGCESLTSVTIPNSVTSVGKYAFSECKSLTEVKFSGISSLISIEKNSFDNPRPNISLVIPYEYSDIALRLIECEIPFTAKQTKPLDVNSIYLDRNVSKYYSTNSEISLANTMNLVVDYSFKQMVSFDKFVVKLPSDSELISVIIGKVTCEYKIDSNGILTIDGKYFKNNSDKIVISVKVTGTRSLTSYAKIYYSVNNVKYSDIIGIINIRNNLLTLNVPHATSSNSITVSGITLPEKNVDIYVDGIKQKSILSRKTGSFSTSFELIGATNGKSYLIEAKTDNAMVSKQITYNKDSVKVISAKMYYRGNEYNLLEQKGKNPVISWAANTEFVFVIKLDKYTNVESVYVVSSKGSDERIIKAYYNSNNGTFVAKGFKNYVPGTISITVNDTITINSIKSEISEMKTIKNETDYSNIVIKPIENTTNKNTKNGEYKALLCNKETKEDLIDFSYSREKVDSVPSEFIKSKNCINTVENGKNKYTILSVSEDKKTVECTTYSEAIAVVDDDLGTSLMKDYIKEYTKEVILGGEYDDVFSALDEFISIVEKANSIIDIPKDTINSFNKWYNLHKESKNAIINNPNLSEQEKQDALSNLEIADACYAIYVGVELISNLVICLVTLTDEFSEVPIVGDAYDWFTGYLIDKMSDAKGDMQEMLESLFRIFSGDAVTVSYKYSIDPSGFVYEAVPSNRLGGVTATIYYSLNADGSNAQKWDASEYDQTNPIITYADGTYFWDVPEGYWRVKYEKEGYETTYSEWLPVPPPQLDVNIGMISTVAPEIDFINVYQDEAEIKFSQYMDISRITTSNIVFTSGGKPISGTFKTVDKENNYDGSKTFATTFLFIPDNEFSNSVDITVSNVKNYSGKSIAATYKSNQNVVYKMQSVEAPEEVSIGYDSVGTITLVAKPVLAAKGKKVHISLSNSYIAALDSSGVTFDENGVAKIKISTLLPGTVELTYSIEGTTFAGKVTINVELFSNIPVEGISLNKESTELEVGDSTTLIAVINPENASNQKIKWVSSDDKIATVDEDGVVAALSEGKAEIKAITEDGKFEAMCVVTVKQTLAPPVLLDSISIKTLPSKTSYYVGDELDLNGLSLEAKYSDGTTKIITSGFACSLKELTSTGNKTITVTYEGKTASFDVAVVEKEIPASKVQSVSVEDITLNYKKSATITPIIDADKGAEYTVTYTSSNPSVARVDENGNVYGAKKGSADITVTVTDSYGNSVSDTCKVNVTYTWWQWIIVIVLFGWIWY